jgi:hypothetical protein
MAATAIDDAASLIDGIPISSLKRFLRGPHKLSLRPVEGQPAVAHLPRRRLRNHTPALLFPSVDPSADDESSPP